MSPFGMFKERRRRKTRAQPFPAEWRDVMHKNVRLYGRMPAALRDELEDHIKVFLDEKQFEGCDGLEVTDEIRVTIAANACVLLLGREADYFPHMTSIFVYPREFVVDVAEEEGGVVSEFVEDRSGESWDRGPVVISWRDIMLESTPARPYNVVIHEFAHQLDLENGAGDGVPALPDDETRARWSRVFTAAYETLTRQRRRDSIIDPYATEDPTEFFAVAVECFFESPSRLRDEVPDVYAQLAQYFRQDPAVW